MSHICSTVLIRCSDSRFERVIESFLNERALVNDCSIVSVDGGVKVLLEDNEAVKQYLLSQLGVAHDKHSVRKFILMDHTDCGAYGGREAIGTANDDLKMHTEKLNAAKDVILKEYPEAEIELIIAHLGEENEIEFMNI